jgi:hypothetical protein
MKLAAVLGAFLVAGRWIRDHLPAAGGVRLAGIAFSGLPATAPQGPT